MSTSLLLLVACAPAPVAPSAGMPFEVSVEAPVDDRWEARLGGAAHRFTVSDLPADERLLRFPVAVRGATVSVDTTARGATFTPPTGPVWRYSGLHAWDARGRELAAWMEPSPEGLALVVDASGAMAPVTVDPVVTSATWTIDGAAAGAWLGASIAGAAGSSGDHNGDGYADLLVGAPYADGGAGQAALYPGGPGGLDTAPDWTTSGAEARAYLGRTVAWAGDLDADGYDELLVGAPWQDGGWADEGAVTLYRGSPTGPTAAATLTNPQERGLFGSALAGAGDIDGDGTPDVLVGASSWTDGDRDEGAVFGWRGATALAGAAPDWTLQVDQAAAGLGEAVDGAGDVNGDGYADIAAGAPGWDGGDADEGAVFVWLGGATGPATGPTWVAAGGQVGAAFGQAVTVAGDVEGDGYGDLLVGSPGWDADVGDEGRVALFLGGAGGLAGAPAWEATGSQAGAALGTAVAWIGDPEGDGYDDVAAGAPGAGERGEGVVFGWSGASLVDPWEIAGGQAGAGLGSTVAGLGDIDGDGRVDLAAGAPGWNAGGEASGRALVYRGSPLTDPDLDGWVAPDDCGPDDPRVYPGAPERCDGVDNDCDGITDPDSAVDAPTWYVDFDGDGYGDDAATRVTCDPGDGWVLFGGDCLDTSAALSPAAAEACDGFDNDCDGAIDDGLLRPYYTDADHDGYGTGAALGEACSIPSGYSSSDQDCNDANSRIRPGASESCDYVDNDCDGATDENLTNTYYLDVDGDGYGEDATFIERCSTPAGYDRDNGDCNDADRSIHPRASELCDGVDQDCDGSVDEGALLSFYVDADGDGYASGEGEAVQGCTAPAGTSAATGDCDDTLPTVSPAAEEVCDGLDNDCNAAVDETAPIRYRDADGDGYGVATDTLAACELPDGYADVTGDCDDHDATTWPDAPELCDGVDQDCDHVADEDLDVTWYWDQDHDGHGDATITQVACSASADWSSLGDDCNDRDAARHPGAPEVCDGADQDCDEVVDEDPVDGEGWYPDADGDGFGDPASPTRACSAPDGTVAAGTDCDDTDPATFPGAPDLAGDGVDQDCDGADPEAPAALDTATKTDASGCGCAGTGSPSSLFAVVAGLLLVGWRRRSPRTTAPR